MASTLTSAEVQQYDRDGYLPARPLMTATRALDLRLRLQAFEESQGMTLGQMPGQMRAKTHLLLPWMNELVHNPKLLDMVESLLGPDLLVYHVTCWLKEPGDGSFVSWHQDGTYFHLDPPNRHVTAWVALTDAHQANGCMRFLPGSHRDGQLHHESGEIRNNLLSNGQVVDREIDESTAVDLVVPLGCVSFHHTHLIHSSSPNNSADRRIGIGVSYIPTSVRHATGKRLTASLVRGQDVHGYFEDEPAPVSEFDDASRAFHSDSCTRFFAPHGSMRTAGEKAG
jgi:non-heme Fe2+,alpha-ketoglutarate-dependent halogenase